MYWWALLITHYIGYFGSVFYYYINDLLIYRKNKWNANKIYEYNSNIWNIWRNDLLASIKNAIYTAIFIYLYWSLLETFKILETLIINVYSIKKTIYYIIIHYLFTETYFYFIHRLMHIKYYKWHKHHHKLQILVASSGLNAELFEHIVLNTAPLYISVLIFGIYYWLLLVIIFLSSINIAKSHSGYKKHYLHYLHHKKINYNYGYGLFIWDKLLGTYSYIL